MGGKLRLGYQRHAPKGSFFTNLMEELSELMLAIDSGETLRHEDHIVNRARHILLIIGGGIAAYKGQRADPVSMNILEKKGNT